MTNRPVKLLSKKLASSLKKLQKDLKPSCFENTEPFDGVFEVTDADGRTRKVFISPKSTMGELEKMVDELERGNDPHVINDRAQELMELIIQKYPYGDALKLIDRMKTLSENEGKIKQVCKLSVSDRGVISFIRPDGKKIKCDFEKRGRIARVLYILFLRQIERSVANPGTPKHICRNQLNKFYEEMLTIYSKMCDDRKRSEMCDSIEQLWRKPSNELSHINTFFDKTFDNEALNGKYYSIEVVGTDEHGDELYTVGLNVEDFDLGCFSISKLKV